MPVSATQKIYEGVDFTLDEYIKVCAEQILRQLYLYNERQNLFDEIKTDNVFDDYLRHWQKRLDWLLELSEEEKIEAHKADNARITKGNENYRKKMAEARARYEKMLGLVEAWNLPSPDHQVLKDHMRIQLERSIDFDCKSIYDIPIIPDLEDWYKNEVAYAKEEVHHYTKRIEESRKNTEFWNRWIGALKR